jgi:polyhydroxyalkanoate synthesis regulator phasin
MKKYLVVLIVIMTFIMPLAGDISPVWAGEVDVLINILAKKGILSPEEARGILADMQKESARETAAVKEVAKETAKETATKVAQKEASSYELPDWVKNTEFKGDMRLRYQNEDRKGDLRPNRDRARMRARLGIVTAVNDQWEAGIGMASGGADPRSTNQTFQDAFSTSDWRLDYAYAKYTPFKWLKLIGGQFKNPIWGTKDLLWDGDIRPQGAAATLKYKPMDNLELFATPAYLVVDENRNLTADPKAWLLQGGLEFKMEQAYIKFAATYYDWKQLDVQAPGATAPNSFAGTNSVHPVTGNLLFDYGAIVGDIEIGTKLPFPIVPFAAVFGQYVKSDADDSRDGFPSAWGKDDDTGWLVGFKFGHEKVKKRWQWQAKYNYRRLEADAWPDFLPDSDAYGGDTNIKGHEIEFTLGLHKNVTIGLDYYNTKPIRTAPGAGDMDETVLQTDLVLKW